MNEETLEKIEEICRKVLSEQLDKLSDNLNDAIEGMVDPVAAAEVSMILDTELKSCWNEDESGRSSMYASLFTDEIILALREESLS